MSDIQETYAELCEWIDGKRSTTNRITGAVEYPKNVELIELADAAIIVGLSAKLNFLTMREGLRAARGLGDLA